MKNDYAEMHMEGDILIGRYKNDVVIDLIGAKEVVQLRKVVSNNVQVPILVDGRYVKQITKEARNYLSTAEGSDGLKSCAILVDSPLTKMLANFLLKINIQKPLIPIKVFNDYENAKIWLKTFNE